MRQRVLLLTDDRRIVERWLPVQDGLVLDTRGYRAWDVEEGHVVPYGEDGDVVLLCEWSAVPLAPDSLTPREVSPAKLQAIGLTSLYEGILDVAYRPASGARVVGTVLMVLLLTFVALLGIGVGTGLWASGKFGEMFSAWFGG